VGRVVGKEVTRDTEAKAVILATEAKAMILAMVGRVVG